MLRQALTGLGVAVSERVLPAGYRGSLFLRGAGRVARLLPPGCVRAAFGPASVVAYGAGLVQRSARGHSDHADLNIFLQRVYHTLIPTARRNVLIPNPEWLPPQRLWQLMLVDEVWCKTRHAVALLSPHAPRCRYVGFSSPDRMERAAPAAADGGWLHLASAGLQKGTDAVLDAWRAHPGWPFLTVLQHKNAALGSDGPNLRYLSLRIGEDELTALLNRCPVHLCPSQSEGFGHSIVEGLSCGALVLATDAPPMNELVDEARGVLVAAGACERVQCGERFAVTADAVADAVQRVLAMSPAAIHNRRSAARSWFEKNHAAFIQRLADALAALKTRPTSPN